MDKTLSKCSFCIIKPIAPVFIVKDLDTANLLYND